MDLNNFYMIITRKEACYATSLSRSFLYSLTDYTLPTSIATTGLGNLNILFGYMIKHKLLKLP